MKKFKLFMCCLGNGITVCNEAVQENGDYKIIAHVASCGKITWYVDPGAYVPGADLLKIEHAADVQRVSWENWLNSMPEAKQYEKLLEIVPHVVFMHVLHMSGDMSDKIAYLKNVCYEKSYF